MSLAPIPHLGDFINGKFVKINKSDNAWENHSPADLKDKVINVEACYDHIEQACFAASEAYKTWRFTSLDYR